MEYNELQKYMVEGMVAQELMNEQNEALVLTESGEAQKVVPAVYYGNPDQRAIRKLIAESLLECSPPCGVTNTANPQKFDPKIEKTKKMIQIIQDMMWRVSDTALIGDDESIMKTVQDACNPLIRTMVQKLYDLWVLNNDSEKKPEAKSEPVNPNASAAVVTPTPEGGESPVLQLTFAQGESIMSPLKKEYVIEEIHGDFLKLKEKATGAKASVSKEIARKWKK